MDYFDEYDDGRPRVQFSRGVASPTPAITGVSPPHLAGCLISSLLLFIAAYFSLDSSPFLFSLLAWFALSLMIAPFAPVSATGGEFSVGRGPALPDPAPELSAVDSAEGNSNRRSRSRKQVEKNPIVFARSDQDSRSGDKSTAQEKKTEEEQEQEEQEWTETDLELLKKQMAKFNVAGDPNRWEKISNPFKGRHGLESVICAVKSVQERKTVQNDPFEQFLKKRKPVNPQSEAGEVSEVNKKEEWSSSDDLALLSALKAFPKDSAMRWEKISAAVPGKSKAGCMKRVSELKKDFRTAKGTE